MPSASRTTPSRFPEPPAASVKTRSTRTVVMRDADYRRQVARSDRQAGLPRLQLEQSSLALQPASVAGQRSVGADHAVAGNDDRDRIAGVGEAHGARRRGMADAPRDLAVADGLAVGNVLQGAPDEPLERISLHRQRHVERRAL